MLNWDFKSDILPAGRSAKVIRQAMLTSGATVEQAVLKDANHFQDRCPFLGRLTLQSREPRGPPIGPIDSLEHCIDCSHH